jgi:hypothetical protein
MNERTNSLIRRYARPTLAFYAFEPESSGQPAMIERRGLRLVVRNDDLPRLISPRYHTGE